MFVCDHGLRQFLLVGLPDAATGDFSGSWVGHPVLKKVQQHLDLALSGIASLNTLHLLQGLVLETL